MATEPNTATIIQMPRRNKGRVRKSQSINSGGSMALADLDGPIPTNVVSLAKRRGFGGFEPPVARVIGVRRQSVRLLIR